MTSHEQHKDRRALVILKSVVILFLTCHMVYFFVLQVLPAYFIVGYSLERQNSLGEAAAPYVAQGMTIIVAFVLFVLTFLFFVRKNRKHLVTASIAGIGGFVVNLILASVLGLDTVLFQLQLKTLLLWGLPMLAVFLYRAAHWVFPEA